jgi:hypothetical protein
VYVWRFLDSDGADAGSSEPFEDRTAAEAWLADSWAGLLGRGIEEVELLEDGEARYRMGLREA